MSLGRRPANYPSTLVTSLAFLLVFLYLTVVLRSLLGWTWCEILKPPGIVMCSGLITCQYYGLFDL